MNIQIKTTTISLTPAISEYVEKKLNGIEKFFQGDETLRFDLELAKTTNHHKNGDIFKAEVHIIAKDTNIYAVAEKEDLYVAIDAIKDEILREVKNSNNKRRSFVRRSGAQLKNIMKGIWPIKN
jgi:putative sigma-54 modulation protein